MLDLVELEFRRVWPAALKPKGEGFGLEAFESYWARNEQRLSHLHPRLVEQWIHKHWDWSPFRFLPLDTLTWRLETWSTERVLAEVVRIEGKPLNAEHDGEVYDEAGKTHPTVAALSQGTWDYPIVVLETPRGIRRRQGPRPGEHFLLIEGHQRTRYLNVLAHRGVRTGPHQVFLVQSPITE